MDSNAIGVGDEPEVDMVLAVANINGPVLVSLSGPDLSIKVYSHIANVVNVHWSHLNQRAKPNDDGPVIRTSISCVNSPHKGSSVLKLLLIGHMSANRDCAIVKNIMAGNH